MQHQEGVLFTRYRQTPPLNKAVCTGVSRPGTHVLQRDSRCEPEKDQATDRSNHFRREVSTDGPDPLQRTLDCVFIRHDPLLWVDIHKPGRDSAGQAIHLTVVAADCLLADQNVIRSSNMAIVWRDPVGIGLTNRINR
jgi:hypothetical protein